MNNLDKLIVASIDEVSGSKIVNRFVGLYVLLVYGPTVVAAIILITIVTVCYMPWWGYALFGLSGACSVFSRYYRINLPGKLFVYIMDFAYLVPLAVFVMIVLPWVIYVPFFGLIAAVCSIVKYVGDTLQEVRD